MGKNWKVKRKGGGGGGGGGGGLDFSSCRGFPIVIATCDVAREREASKELVTILQQAMEDVYPELMNGNSNSDDNDNDDEDEPSVEVAVAPKRKAMTIQEMLEEELASVRETNKKTASGTAQPCVSIKTDVRGVVLVKINIASCCPIVLVKSIFDKVKREKSRLSRYVVRFSPLQYTFYPSYEEYFENIYKMLQNEFTGFSSASYEKMIEEMHDMKRKRLEQEALDSIRNKKAKLEVPIDSLDATSSSSSSSSAVDACGSEAGSNSNSKDENSMIGKEDGLDEKEILRREMIRKQRLEKKNIAATAKQVAASAPEPALKRLDDDSSVSVVPFSYSFHFKFRNHNTLDRGKLTERMKMSMPHFAKYTKNEATKVQVYSEALKNLCGISFMQDVEEYGDFNLRRFQADYVVDEESSMIKSHNSSASGGGKELDVDGENCEDDEEGEDGDDDDHDQ